MSVKNLLLGLLSNRPYYGYELLNTIAALTLGQGEDSINPGQIYATLDRLEKHALIEHLPSDSDDRKYYNATDQGRQEIEAWLRQPVPTYAPRDEFTTKLLLATSLSNVDTAKTIQIQRGFLYQSLHQVTSAREKLPKKELIRRLLYDKTIMHIEADLRWLDILESRKQDLDKQELPEIETRPRGRPSKR
ncbi:MAG TPA: PadR family transcriptional regulator [Anaerolineaceae bacterium]|nr:PadR family transcriptional regulator [Anaerolineaceae bacterium]